MDGFWAWAGTVFLGAGFGTFAGNWVIEVTKGRLASRSQQKVLAQQAEMQQKALAQQAEMQQKALAQQAELQDRQREHQLESQREERKHQVELRNAAALDEARQRFLPTVAAVEELLIHARATEHGPEVEHYSEAGPGDLRGIREALHELHQLATLHPRKDIRDAASELRDELDTAYGDAARYEESSQQRTPRFDHGTYIGWIRTCDDLVEALHDPAHKLDTPG